MERRNVDGWQKYSATVTLPFSTVRIQLKDMLWEGAARVPARPPLAYFDSIAVRLGPCSTVPDTPQNACPVVSAGPPQVLECTDGGASAVLNGTAWDPDGDLMTYNWGQGPTTPVQPSQLFPLGMNYRTLIVSDQICTVSDATSVQVVDTLRPQYLCPPARQAECVAGSAKVPMPVLQALDQCDGILPVISDALGLYSLGKTFVHYKAMDKSGNVNACTVTVTVAELEVWVPSVAL